MKPCNSNSETHPQGDPLGLPFEERRLRSVLSFHARQVFDMPQ